MAVFIILSVEDRLKFIKLYTINMYSVFYVNYTSTDLFLKYRIFFFPSFFLKVLFI